MIVRWPGSNCAHRDNRTATTRSGTLWDTVNTISMRIKSRPADARRPRRTKTVPDDVTIT
jgi:hypothetical protein